MLMQGVFVFPMSSRRQFRRLMIVTSVLLLVSIGFHVYFFRRVESGILFQSPASLPVQTGATVNETKLANVLDRYEKKSTVRAAALSLVPLVAEPSK